MALKNNTWKVNQWYDQAVAGNATYSGEIQFWVWGKNDNGLLGQNQPQTTNISSPVQMPGSWSKESVPFQGTVGKNIILPKTDGTLWGWGRNDNANLAMNDKVMRSSPTQIGSDTDWAKSGVLEEQGWAIKTDGSLWMWGDNNYGQLGQNERTYRSSPVQLGSDTTWERLYAGGYGRSFGKKTDGTVWCWGRGGGILGQNQPANSHYSSPVQVDGAWSVFSAGNPGNAGGIKTDGTFWIWGSQPKGELGQNEVGDSAQKSSPVQVPGTNWQTVKLYNKGWGAIKTDGTLWLIGGNYYGKLGQNNETDYSSPIQIPGTNWNTISFSYKGMHASKTDGTFWSWGFNNEGQLGQNNIVSYSSPVQVPGTDWYTISAIGGSGQGTFGVKNV